MDDGQNSTSGYKRPPRHTQFQPGRSGNPHGRPKKKGATFAESIEKELSTLITVVEGGKRQRITKLHAIVKQQTNKAVSGDPKATALVMSALERRDYDALDTLAPVLQAMRAIHTKHEALDAGTDRGVDHQQVNHDQD
jgi:hypothetical protein